MIPNVKEILIINRILKEIEKDRWQRVHVSRSIKPRMMEFPLFGWHLDWR
jgi:hypothetical protein